MGLRSIVQRRVASFRFAIRGIRFLFASQVHAWVHLLASLVVIAAGFLLRATATEWCLLTLSIGLVWSAEAFNTAVEVVVDLASPQHHDLAGRAKDVAAGAVLLASMSAATVGLIVFGPKLLPHLNAPAFKIFE